jgi:hypothetical protein
MAYAERHVITVTTAADGTATAFSPVLMGKLSAIHYVKTDFVNGVDFAIVSEATGESLWTENDVNASKTVAPRQATHDSNGAASKYAVGGEPVEDKIALANDRIKISIAAGGNGKIGTFHLVIE